MVHQRSRRRIHPIGMAHCFSRNKKFDRRIFRVRCKIQEEFDATKVTFISIRRYLGEHTSSSFACVLLNLELAARWYYRRFCGNVSSLFHRKTFATAERCPVLPFLGSGKSKSAPAIANTRRRLDALFPG